MLNAGICLRCFMTHLDKNRKKSILEEKMIYDNQEITFGKAVAMEIEGSLNKNTMPKCLISSSDKSIIIIENEILPENCHYRLEQLMAMDENAK